MVDGIERVHECLGVKVVDVCEEGANGIVGPGVVEDEKLDIWDGLEKGLWVEAGYLLPAVRKQETMRL